MHTMMMCSMGARSSSGESSPPVPLDELSLSPDEPSLEDDEDDVDPSPEEEDDDVGTPLLDVDGSIVLLPLLPDVVEPSLSVPAPPTSSSPHPAAVVDTSAAVPCNNFRRDNFARRASNAFLFIRRARYQSPSFARSSYQCVGRFGSVIT
jgi:hypothetical protein